MTMTYKEKAEWLDDIKTIESWGATHAITFNTYAKLTPPRVGALVREFEKRIDKKLFIGPNPLFIGTEWIHYYEYDSGNAHFHSVVKLSPHQVADFKKYGPHIWSGLCQSNHNKKGQLWIDDYCPRCATYISKKRVLMKNNNYRLVPSTGTLACSATA